MPRLFYSFAHVGVGVVLMKFDLLTGFLRRQKSSVMVLGFIFTLSASLLRIRMLWSAREGLWSPLDPDTETYAYFAKLILSKGVTAYTNVSRVPFWPIVVAPFYALFGLNNITIKLASFFFGILTVLATYQVGKTAFGNKAGVLASFLYAVSFYVVFDAYRGLREELFSFLLLCLIYFAIQRRTGSHLNLLASAILTVMLYFTRTDGALVVLPTMLVYIVLSSISKKQRIPFKKLFLISVMFALSIAGWSWYSAKLSGDPFAESTAYASYNYFVEFQKGVGAFPRVTMSDYLFKYHTLTQLLVATLQGSMWIFQLLSLSLAFGYPAYSSPIALMVISFLLILFFSSAVTLWKEKRNWYFPLLYATVVPYLGMFQGLGVIETARNLVPFAPILTITVAYSVVRIYGFLVSSIDQHLCFGRVIDRGILALRLILYGILAFFLLGYVSVNYLYLLAWALLPINFADLFFLSFVAILCLAWVILRSFEK
ncbi:MAG: glycosyltransferase family 39 protein [Candidatus Bathyarchaeia archaeon]